MIVYPAIDLKDGKCVRLIQGDFDKSTTYNENPLDQAKYFENLGVEWLHCVDLDGAKTGQSTNIKSIKDIISNTKLKVQVGGGVRDIEKIRSLIDVGAKNIVLGTAIYEKKLFLEEATDYFPNQISIALDIKNNEIAVRGWTKVMSQNVNDFLSSINSFNITSVICTDVMRDGMKKGINFDMINNILENTSIPCVVSGGASTLEDLIKLKAKNNNQIYGVIIGKALYDKSIKLNDALSVTK